MTPGKKRQEKRNDDQVKINYPKNDKKTVNDSAHRRKVNTDNEIEQK